MIQLAAESKTQSLTVSDLSFCATIGHPAQQRVEICIKGTEPLQECDLKMEDVLSKLNGLQRRLGAMAAPLFGVHTTLTAARERYQKRYESLAASHLRLRL